MTIELHISEDVGRRMLEAIASAAPGERIEHELRLKLVGADKYTAGLKTLANGAEVNGEYFEPCVVKVRADL